MNDVVRNDDKYKVLLESTKAIPWQLNWETKQFSYIGPQIEELLGWPQSSWVTAQDWIDRIHVDEREQTANYCITQSENGIDHEADYRALKADGSFVWVRDVVHVIRKDGITTDLIGFIFDISERKKIEQELIVFNKQLETLSMQDGLTGVANRRLFGQTLKSVWTRAQRSRQPISLVVLDIDQFKQYNDHYGHVEGDECLIRVAQALNDIPMRATDLFARYGGEEFVLLLPETGREAAIEIAEKCRRAVLDLKIPHQASSISDIITISAGVNTVNPSADTEPSSLFVDADKMLYQAKKNGRNRVAAFNEQGAPHLSIRAV